jgi:hypothetical protein
VADRCFRGYPLEPFAAKQGAKLDHAEKQLGLGGRLMDRTTTLQAHTTPIPPAHPLRENQRHPRWNRLASPHRIAMGLSAKPATAPLILLTQQM